jgi:hypothetical protein
MNLARCGPQGSQKTCTAPACGAPTVASMDVTFTKMAGRRYLMTVVRERGPQLAARHGPGYDEYLPHDAVHFLVEAEARLTGGVFGRIAAGQSNIFWAADARELRRQARREARRRPSATERADMARSEQLASICQPLWELREGHRRELPLWFSSLTPESLESLESPLCERILARLNQFAARWHALPIGRSITLSWPFDGHGRVVRRYETRHRTGSRLICFDA